MSNWSETQLTAKGRALDAKVTAGLTTLTFTRMKIGSGNVIPEEIDTMVDLKSPRLVIGISSCEVSEVDPTICSVIGVAKSDDVETSFLVKEQGLFATDPDDGEILYAVMIDSEPDKMPNKNVPSPLSIMYQINIVSDNAADITAIIDPAGLVTVQTMNAAINSHDSNATAHGAAISAHNEDTSAHKNLYGFFLRQPSKYYALGTVVYLPSIGAGLYLECTTAGTTDSGDLVISTPTPNDTVTDGSVVWTIKKVGTDPNALTREITPAFNTRDVITTSGTYTAPVTGWYKITVKGGGGGGGSGIFYDSTEYTAGGGGGEGGTTIKYIYMTEGDSANVVIGAGGAGGDIGSYPAGNGGDTSVTSNGNTYTAGGGGGGYSVYANGSGYGVGGVGGSGTINGCAGGSGFRDNTAHGAIAGSGGGTGGGTGGGIYNIPTPKAGTQGGGGGGGSAQNGSSQTGMAGGDGYVWFEYFATI